MMKTYVPGLTLFTECAVRSVPAKEREYEDESEKAWGQPWLALELSLLKVELDLGSLIGNPCSSVKENGCQER